MKSILFILLMIYSLISIGQVVEVSSIDKELSACLESSESYSTAGMTECMIQAAKKWDTELNKVYQKLLGSLSKDAKEKLRASQRKWIEYRDSEIQFSNQFYHELGGSMWIPVKAEKILSLTKTRTLELEGYLVNQIDRE
jgi:uncharacterized protein YecT (DUF1311 family)